MSHFKKINNYTIVSRGTMKLIGVAVDDAMSRRVWSVRARWLLRRIDTRLSKRHVRVVERRVSRRTRPVRRRRAMQRRVGCLSVGRDVERHRLSKFDRRV